MIDTGNSVRIGLLGLAIAIASPAAAAWWSTDTDVKAMCEKNDGGRWNGGNHGGLSGWCQQTAAGRDWQTPGTANNTIMHERISREIYAVAPLGVMCRGMHAGADGSGGYFCQYMIK